MGYSRLPLVAKKLVGTVDICQKRYNLQISNHGHNDWGVQDIRRA